jgi:hypothetical protein
MDVSDYLHAQIYLTMWQGERSVPRPSSLKPVTSGLITIIKCLARRFFIVAFNHEPIPEFVPFLITMYHKIILRAHKNL